MLLSHSYSPDLFSPTPLEFSWNTKKGSVFTAWLWRFSQRLWLRWVCIQSIPVHFSLGTLPQNPRYGHNPTAVRFLGLSSIAHPAPCSRPTPGPRFCALSSVPGPQWARYLKQHPQVSPPALSSDPVFSSAHHPSSPATRTRTRVSRHLWGERWWRRGPSSSKAPDGTARPARNSLAPPHTHAHLTSRQDRCVNLPGESQVERKNRDWISTPASGPTFLTEGAQEGVCTPRRMRSKRCVCAHTAHAPWVGRVQCWLRFSRHSGRVLEPQGLWLMRKGHKDYFFFFPGQSFSCIH